MKLPRVQIRKGVSAMQKMKIVSYILFPMLFAGCSGQKIRENMYQGIYEGSCIENQRGSTPADNMGKPDMSYDQYSQQRKEIIKRDQQ